MANDAQLKLQKHYALSGHVAKFFSLLVLHDHVSPKMCADKIGYVDQKALAYRLRGRLKVMKSKVVVHSVRGLGYFLDDAARERVRTECGIIIPHVTETIHGGAQVPSDT